MEHLDRLIEIFNACWEMYAAMPAILKEAVEKIYVHRGWDLLNSFYTGKGDPIYPTFEDLMKELPAIINNISFFHKKHHILSGSSIPSRSMPRESTVAKVAIRQSLMLRTRASGSRSIGVS